MTRARFPEGSRPGRQGGLEIEGAGTGAGVTAIVAARAAAAEAAAGAFVPAVANE